jgi:hypothetical protein
MVKIGSASGYFKSQKNAQLMHKAQDFPWAL